ncbi:MAG: tetratricopeptide repeat protein [Spirochaetaceae bacterium]|nr:tetratricopeptide repeat protein [Spirochaetaceae bacterium]
MAEKNTEEKKSFADNVGGFLTKYRVLFIGVIIALFVVAIVWGIFSMMSTSSHEKGLNQLDSIVYTMTKAASTASDDASIDAAREVALPQLLDLAGKNKGNIVGLRANMAAAEVYFSQGKWSEARDCWLESAATKDAGYTAPICYYNAAVCSEELADVDAAIRYYEKALSSGECEFEPHILFSLGRLHEGKGDFVAASDNYLSLKDKYPSDSWTSLAESRLIALRAEGKIQ